MMVPSMSKSNPSKVTSSGGALKSPVLLTVPILEVVMVSVKRFQRQ